MTPPPSFRPQRSGVEKSHAETWHAPWWQEISRLYVSIEPKVFATIPEGSSARDDDAGRQHTVIPGIKLTRTLPRTLRHFDRSEAEWRNLTLKCGKPHDGRRSLGSAFHESPKPLPPIPAHSPARGGSAVLCDLTVFNGARAAAQSSCFPLRVAKELDS